MKLGWLLCGLALSMSAEVNVKDIVRRSADAEDRSWKEAPHYVFTERDVEEKLDSRGGIKTKSVNTYEVMVLEGSEYRRMVKRDDQPLSAEQQRIEEEKFIAERERRKHESASARSRRIGKYEKEREQDHQMMREMVDAFDFKLAGEEKVAGHDTWLLHATPKPGYVPKTRDTKVLLGMKGKLWIDKTEYQWVKVEAEVIRPVSFYAVATVGPGTKFRLEQEPVGEGVWLPKHFSVRVNSTILFFSHNSNDDETYSNYKLGSGQAAKR